jgi:hypothetical protein
LPRESLVSDIPAVDGNFEKVFYGVGFALASTDSAPSSMISMISKLVPTGSRKTKREERGEG